MTDRLRADLVVGGLWPGALLGDDYGHAIVIACNDDGTYWIHGPFTNDTHAKLNGSLRLRLDDPLGLGLAGLAARVATRVKGCRSELPPWLALQPRRHALASYKTLVLYWAEVNWRCDWRASGDVPMLVRCSTYIALTDRLCAAVGLQLAPEVARWERLTNGDWVLRTEACSAWFTADPVPRIECGFWGNVLALADIGPDDWQAALEACLLEVTS